MGLPRFFDISYVKTPAYAGANLMISSLSRAALLLLAHFKGMVCDDCGGTRHSVVLNHSLAWCFHCKDCDEVTIITPDIRRQLRLG